MSSTEQEPASANSAGRIILAGLFGLVLFVVGLLVGNLFLPELLGDAPPSSVLAPQPTLAAAASTATSLPATPTPTAVPPTPTAPPPTATPVPPTPTVIPPTATAIPPTATPPPPTATPTVVPTPTPPRTPSSIFAPEPTEAATPAATGTAAPAGGGTATAPTAATAIAAATPTAGPTATPTVGVPTPTQPPFAATDRVASELPVNFRAGPGTTFASQAALPPGTLLAATGNAQTTEGVLWRQFRISNGTVGWIRAENVSPIQ